MNLFQRNLNQSGTEILAGRSSITAKQTESAMKKFITSKEDDLLALQLEAQKLMDLGPETTESLRPVGKDFDGAKWSQLILTNALQTEIVEKELEIMEEKYKTIFGVVPKKPTRRTSTKKTQGADVVEE